MYIIISTAMSIDGKIGTEDRKSIRLSSEKDFAAVDELRAECDAILVGSTTLNNDNPSLVLRKSGKNPMKVAISSELDLNVNCNFLQKGDDKKIIFTTEKASADKVEKIRKYADVVVSDDDKVDVHNLVTKLESVGVKKLLVEGGGETNALFLGAGIVDELRVMVAPVIVGGKKSPTLVDGEMFDKLKKFTLNGTEQLGDTLVLHYIK